MDWQYKFAALNALKGACLRMREPNNWYVDQPIEVKQGPVLWNDHGSGKCPETAVLDHWTRLTELKPDEYLVINAAAPHRKAVRWNGFMWEAVKEEL